MEDKEKATPVTPDEIEDIRVTLELQNGSGSLQLAHRHVLWSEDHSHPL